MKKIMIILFSIFFGSCANDDIANKNVLDIYPINEFNSIKPSAQNTDFVIANSHNFQKLIEAGDPLNSGEILPIRNDFTGYVPKLNSSTKGYLSINSETTPGGVSILDINLNEETKLWDILDSNAVSFENFGGTRNNCSGTVTPWNTIISCEEFAGSDDDNLDGYIDFGWAIEINPSTNMVIDKLWAMGNFAHENAVVHPNLKTVYQGADSNPGYLFKFVANLEKDLSNGDLFVYKGSKNGNGEWIMLENTTVEQRNSTLQQCTAVEATVFNGIEDVEIGPNGMVYFAVKGEGIVYRFQDSNPLSGTSQIFMTPFVGQMDYEIMVNTETIIAPWGYGNDNMAFDGEGNLWVLQDGGNNYIWVVENGHKQEAPKVKLFGIAPLGSEPTGITFTPDFKYLFMSIQGPDEENAITFQIDAAGENVTFDNHTTLVISRKENFE